MKLVLYFAATISLLAADSGKDRLLLEISRLSKISDGVVGLSAIHVESGAGVNQNFDQRFPMASTFKVPVAIQLLSRVDRGEVRLDQMITVEPRDLHPGSGTLSTLFNKPGVALSVRNLLELMLLISDNSATDIVLRLAGGPEAVTAKMRELGITGIRVDRSTANLIADWRGAKLPAESDWSPLAFGMALASVTPEEQNAANNRFDQDPRDTAEPRAMTDLLVQIYNKKLHKPETAALLLDIMRRCQSGEARIRGILPPDTTVAHKTGSIGGSINDVGILTLPDGAGHVALSLFVKRGSNTEKSERAIAQIARSVYDYFLFNSR